MLYFVDALGAIFREILIAANYCLPWRQLSISVFLNKTRLFHTWHWGQGPIRDLWSEWEEAGPVRYDQNERRQVQSDMVEWEEAGPIRDLWSEWEGEGPIRDLWSEWEEAGPTRNTFFR